MTNINQSQLLLANLNTDSHDNLRKDSCFYLLNGDITDYGNSNQTVMVQNTSSNELCVKLPFNFDLVGELNLDKNNQILFLRNKDISAIYLMDKDKCTIVEVVTAKCLNFSKDHWITGKYKFINDKRRIYFTDGINPVRYLDIDQPYPKKTLKECKECNNYELNELDCNALNFWKSKKIPGITTEIISGNIPNGVYQIAISTIDGDSPTSEYFIYSDVFKLHSNKSSRFGIKVNFDCFDSNIDKYRLVLISNREDRGTSAQIIGTFESTQQEVIITDLDTSRFLPITNEELLHTEVYYDSADYMDTNSEVLVLGGLKEKDYLHYQPQANDIVSEWQIVKVKAQDAHKVPSFMSDEVYAFEIEWLYGNGQSAGRYHIPNNVELYDQWKINVTGKDAINVDSCSKRYSKYWEVYNTAQVSWIADNEENDNGEQEVTLQPKQSCGNLYGFEGYNLNVPYLIKYKDCTGQIVEDYTDNLKNYQFCTTDPTSVVLTPEEEFPVFKVPDDLVIQGPVAPLSECFKWTINERFRGYEGHIIVPFRCVQPDFGFVRCHEDSVVDETVLLDKYVETRFQMCPPGGPIQVFITLEKPTLKYIAKCPPLNASTCGIKYKFEGYNLDIPYIVKYKNCEGVLVTKEVVTLKNYTFCTNDFASISATPKQDLAFSVDNDIIPGSIIQTPCRNYTIHPKYTGIHGTLTLHNQCEPGDCAITCPTTPCVNYTGDLTSYVTNPLPVCETIVTDPGTIFVTATPPTVKVVGPCDTIPPNKSCNFEVVAKGSFAYWESNIKYPNTDSFTNLQYKNGSLCQTGLKYHKFPDRTQTWLDPSDNKYKSLPHIHNSTKDCQSKEYVYVLTAGFKNIKFPVDCNGDPVKDIAGYRIHVGDRSTNKSILHKGMIYNMREEKLSDCTTSLFPNYPYNDLNPDIFIGTSGFVYEQPYTGTINNYEGYFNPLKLTHHNRFQYISPNTQIAELEGDATELYTYAEENGYVEGEFQAEERFPKIVLFSTEVYNIIAAIIAAAAGAGFFSALGANIMESIINVMDKLLNMFRDGLNDVNYAFRQVMFSNYSKSNRVNIVQGNRRRQIELASFLQSSKQLINGEKINNYQRENGIYLKLGSNLDAPYVKEKSRIKMGERIGGGILGRPFDEGKNPDGTCQLHFNDCNQDKLKTSSYYVGLKKYNPSQYGNLNDFVTRPITDILKTEETPVIYGGDIYITKHSYVRKFPFFTTLPLDLPDGSPFNMTQYANIGFPKFYIDNDKTSDFINLITRGAPVIDLFATYALKKQTRFHYLDDVGEPIKGSCSNTLKDCEGSLLFREDGRFYTHITAIASYYCESEFIGDYREVNEYFFSNHYPLKSKEDFGKYKYLESPEQFLYNFQMLSQGVLGKTRHVALDKDCCDKQKTSDTRVIFSLKHDTQKYRDAWLNFRPLNYHQFDGHDGKLTAVHAINDYNLLFSFENNTYVTQADDGLVTQNGSTVYLGAGSIFQRRMKKISSDENGLGGSIDRFSFVNTPYGVFWADRIRKAFCSYTQGFENISDGIQSWSNEFLNSDIKGSYDPFTKNVYWTGKDNWTLSYKPEAKNFISFHSWLPERYIRERYNILTYKNNAIWKHNSKSSYQTFYGELHPFDIGYNINLKFLSNVLQSISVYSEFLTNVGYGSKVYDSTKFFNKIFIYNDYASTGLKGLKVKDLENPEDSLYQYDRTSDYEVTPIENSLYQINGFQNIGSGQPLVKWNNDGISYEPLNVNEGIREFSNNTIRGTYANVHLINDVYNQYKILCKLSLEMIQNIKQ